MNSHLLSSLLHPPLFLVYFSEVLRWVFFYSVGQIHREMEENDPKFLCEITLVFVSPGLTSLQTWSVSAVLLLLLHCVHGLNCFWTCVQALFTGPMIVGLCGGFLLGVGCVFICFVLFSLGWWVTHVHF